MDPRAEASERLWCALPGPGLGPDLSRRLRELAPAGVILFDRNLESEAQTRELVAGIRELAGGGTFVGIDQEGGRVNRLRRIVEAFSALPTAREQAAWPLGRLELAWRLVGECLASLGFDVDFAPVVDLDASEGANAIGPRSFGTDPEAVSRMAGAVLVGLEHAGVAGCLKHYPGLGGTTADTHLEQSVSPVDARALWDVHGRPFRDLAGLAPLVMTAHAAYPAVDGDAAGPATFSRALLADWLRGRAAYDGLVISDDLEMKAVSSSDTPGALARRAVRAGVDWVLFCGGLDAPLRARDALAEEVERGRLGSDGFARTARRAAALRGRLSAAKGPRPLALASRDLASCLT